MTDSFAFPADVPPATAYKAVSSANYRHQKQGRRYRVHRLTHEIRCWRVA